MHWRWYILLLVFPGYHLAGKAQQIKVLNSGPLCNIRSMSVVNAKIAWLGASNGYIGFTINGGQSWKWQQVKEFEQSDFRDVQAFSNHEAIIMSSGNPALILRTVDGGKSWHVVYRNNDKAYFFDAFDFENKNHGILAGDPMNGRFLILETKDRGQSWHQLQQSPIAQAGEACFAASGTCIAWLNKNQFAVVTGGTKTRLLTYHTLKQKWTCQALPLQQRKPSTGAFSIATSKQYNVIVGGNYQSPLLPDSTACYFANNEQTLTLSLQMPLGYQSCVTYIKKNIFVSTGAAGTHITYDAGKHWTQIDKTSYNVCQKIKQENSVLLAGDKGRIGIFKID